MGSAVRNAPRAFHVHRHAAGIYKSRGISRAIDTSCTEILTCGPGNFLDNNDPSSAPITDWLRRAKDGDTHAEEYLFRAIYGKLRRLAASNIRAENGRSGMEPSELVNEVYLRLFGTGMKDYQNRVHFFSVAARAMRCILVDLARKRKARKRDGGVQLELESIIPAPFQWPERIIDFENVLKRLAEFDPRAAQIVEFKIFLGLTDSQIAELLEKSARTIKREYRAAKAWLQAELFPGELVIAAGAGNEC